MSKITTIFNRVIEVMGEKFPAMTTIPYPYSLPDNDANLLKAGYGIKLGEQNPLTLEYCNMTNDRNVSIVFTKEVVRLDSDNVPVDMAAVELAEDCYEIQKILYNYNEMGIEDMIAKVDLGSVSDPQEILVGNSKFLSMEASFTFTIIESL